MACCALYAVFSNKVLPYVYDWQQQQQKMAISFLPLGASEIPRQHRTGEYPNLASEFSFNNQCFLKAALSTHARSLHLNPYFKLYFK